jgi:hypothetical protein
MLLLFILTAPIFFGTLMWVGGVWDDVTITRDELNEPCRLCGRSPMWVAPLITCGHCRQKYGVDVRSEVCDMHTGHNKGAPS